MYNSSGWGQHPARDAAHHRDLRPRHAGRGSHQRVGRHAEICTLKFWTTEEFQNLKYLPNIISFPDTLPLSCNWPNNQEIEIHGPFQALTLSERLERLREVAPESGVCLARILIWSGLISAPLLWNGNRQHGGLAVEGVEDEPED